MTPTTLLIGHVNWFPAIIQLSCQRQGMHREGRQPPFLKLVKATCDLKCIVYGINNFIISNTRLQQPINDFVCLSYHSLATHLQIST